MCAWPACHYVITRPGATSAQHRGLIYYNYNARQNTPVSIWREERGDHKPQCLERNLLGTEYNDNENIQEQVFGNLCQCVD